MLDHQLKLLMRSNRMTLMDGIVLGFGLMLSVPLCAALIWLTLTFLGITLKEVI